MSAPASTPDPQLVNDLLTSWPQIYERHPDHVALLSELVWERLENGPPGVKAEDRQQEIVADLQRDPRAEKALADLQTASANLPAVKAAQAKGQPERDRSQEKLAAVGIGLVVGAVVAGSIVIHELNEFHAHG